MGILSRLFGKGAPASSAEDPAAGPLLVNAYATVRELPPLDFPHAFNSGRDLSDPELHPHLQGFTGYVMARGDGQMTGARYHLWRHIQRVHNQVSFAVLEAALPAVEAWARSANAVLFLPDGSVRAPDMAVLMTADGAFGSDAQLPYPPDALARRGRTLERLNGADPQPPVGMPPALGEAEVALRSASEVARRALALVRVAARAAEIASEGAAAIPEASGIEASASDGFTLTERSFLEADVPDDQLVAETAWRFEAANVLLWALDAEGADIARADARADPDTLLRAALALAADGPTPAAARLRPAAEILDALDLAWRQHWIVRQARQKGFVPDGIDPDVIGERHYALNWLTGFHNDPGTDWDDTDTPT